MWELPRRAFSMPKGGEPMPRKPKRPCSYPGCPRLTDGGSARNTRSWRPNATRSTTETRQQSVGTGVPGNASGTDTCTHTPLCEKCLKEGRLTEAEQVHHIKPLAEGGDHSDGNLMSLCSSCHARSMRSVVTGGTQVRRNILSLISRLIVTV